MLLRDFIDLFQLPQVRINLMQEKTAENDPFYADAVAKFYKEAVALHPKFLFVARKFEFGFAMCKLPGSFEAYLALLDSSARTNYRKAQRHGYEFRRFDYNAHLDDIRAIWLSTPVRQGVLPRKMR